MVIQMIVKRVCPPSGEAESVATIEEVVERAIPVVRKSPGREGGGDKMTS